MPGHRVVRLEGIYEARLWSVVAPRNHANIGSNGIIGGGFIVDENVETNVASGNTAGRDTPAVLSVL